MNRFLKNKTAVALVVSFFFIAITLSTVAYSIWQNDGLPVMAQSGNDRQSSGQAWDGGADPDEGESDPDLDDEIDDEEGPDTPEPEEEALPDKPVSFNRPSEMRAVFLAPGEDFLKTDGLSDSQIKAEIDRAIASAKELTMNTVIIDTVYSNRVIYNAGNLPGLDNVGFDILSYIAGQSRAQGMYVYAIYDAKLVPENKGKIMKMVAVESDKLDSLRSNVEAVADSYDLDGILIDDYYNEQEEQSYPTYLRAGGGIGFENYMRQSPRTVVETVSRTVKSAAPGMQVGLLSDSVWENAEDAEGGSQTAAAFTTLGSGNADTKAFVEDGLVDFVAVKAYSSTKNTSVPFVEVVDWWGSLAQENGIPLYVVHASSKICTEETGWAPHDQLAVQVIEASGMTGYAGSVFDSLGRLEENPKDATSTLIKVFNEEVDPEFILTELQVTKPDQTSYSTFEPTVTFTGASDPTSPLTMNGELIERDASGYFTLNIELKAGANQFVIEHKEKTITYNITRQVQILKDIEPVGSIATDGGMNITITAVAYADAEVYATLNGSRISMALDETESDDDENKDSNYKRFIGEYVTPDAAYDVQNLGNIIVYGSWQGMSESKQGASVKINKLPEPAADGNLVQVIKDQAETFPPTALNDISNGNYYPLPKGALDFAVGDEIVYKSGSNTKVYQMLASNQRVYSSDIQKVSGTLGGNKVSGITVSADKSYTKVILNTSQKVSYTFKYASDGLTVQLHNTVTVPSSMNLSKNPMFESAKWDGATLKLSFIKSNGFMGFKGYYDTDGNLVFRFNNPPSSIGAARIVVDPGHGGPDPGAIGFLKDYPEKVINAKIAGYLAKELENRGATVMLIDTSGSSKVTLESRVQQTKNFNADIFVSVHSNSSASSKSSGVEAFYFYPFGSTLAKKASANLSGAIGTSDRGSKYGVYYVTRCSEYTSILAECGFVSNKNEYEKLIKSANQKAQAKSLADAVESAISAAYSGTGATGTESNGNVKEVSGDEEKSLSLDKENLTLKVGDTYTLEASVSGAKWESSDDTVAKVSASGKVSAQKAGKATITATAGEEEAVCTVKVTEGDDSEEDGDEDSSSSNEDELILEDDGSGGSNTSPVSGKYAISKNTLSISVGESMNLTASYMGSSEDITWETSDEYVVTVDQNGNVKGMSGGTAVIEAIHPQGGSLQCRVTVISGEDVGIASFALESAKLTLEPNEEYNMDPVITGVDTDDVTIEWDSNDEDVATVDEDGVITAVGEGRAVITASVSETGHSAACTVTVQESGGGDIQLYLG